jgi:hypothetical protein
MLLSVQKLPATCHNALLITHLNLCAYLVNYPNAVNDSSYLLFPAHFDSDLAIVFVAPCYHIVYSSSMVPGGLEVLEKNGQREISYQ